MSGKQYKRLRQNLRNMGIDVQNKQYKEIKYPYQSLEYNEEEKKFETIIKYKSQFILHEDCGRAIYKEAKKCL